MSSFGQSEPAGRFDEALLSKKRLISAAPFRFDSYANRKGKGMHKALERLTHFCRGARCLGLAGAAVQREDLSLSSSVL